MKGIYNVPFLCQKALKFPAINQKNYLRKVVFHGLTIYILICHCTINKSVARLTFDIKSLKTISDTTHHDKFFYLKKMKRIMMICK